jgi:large repetitive protein
VNRILKKSKRRGRRGQGLVEFALILPMLLMVIIGIFEFGRILLIYSSLFNAAREGSRYGITNPRDYDGIRAASVDRMMLIPPDDLNDASLVVVRYDGGPDSGAPHTDYETVTAGDRVWVDVEYAIEPMTLFFAPVVNNLTLQTRARRTIQSVGTLVSAPPEEAPPPGGDDPTDPGDGEDPATDPQITISPTCGPAGSATTISVSGSGWTGDDRVDVFFDGDSKENNSQINDDGSFVFSFSVTPANGAYDVAVTGRQSDVSRVATYLVPCKSPIQIAEPVRARDTEVTGSAEPGETVTLFVNGVEHGQATVDAGGNFSFSVDRSLLKEGDDVTVSGYDESDTVTVEAAESLAPIIIDPVDVGDTVVTGDAEPGEQVRLLLNDVPQETVVVDADGRFRFSGLSSLQAGTTVTVEGLNGYEAIDSVVVLANVVIDRPVRADETQVSGSAHVGESVVLSIEGAGTYGPVVVSDAGTFVFSGLPELQGGQRVTVSGVDAYRASDSVLVEKKIVIDRPVKAEQVYITGDAEPGKIVTLFVDEGTGESSRGSVTVDASGRFSFINLSPLPAGATVIVRGYDHEDRVEVVIPIIIDTPIKTDHTQVAGSAQPGSSVTLDVDGGCIGTLQLYQPVAVARRGDGDCPWLRS